MPTETTEKPRVCRTCGFVGETLTFPSGAGFTTPGACPRCTWVVRRPKEDEE